MTEKKDMFQAQVHVNIFDISDEINSTFNKSGKNFSSRYKNKSAFKFCKQDKLKI